MADPLHLTDAALWPTLPMAEWRRTIRKKEYAMAGFAEEFRKCNFRGGLDGFHPSSQLEGNDGIRIHNS
jgi:hypothetical protein